MDWSTYSNEALLEEHSNWIARITLIAFGKAINGRKKSKKPIALTERAIYSALTPEQIEFHKQISTEMLRRLNVQD